MASNGAEQPNGVSDPGLDPESGKGQEGENWQNSNSLSRLLNSIVHS